MPKVDPDCEVSSSITAAPAPLPPGQTSAAPSFGFGGTSTPAVQPTALSPTSGFGSTPTPGFTNNSFNSNSGFGQSNAFGGSSGGFGGQQNNFITQQSQQPSTATANAFGEVMAAQAASGQPQEHWMKSFWRPAMGWLYMLICFCDFVAFPLLSMFLPIIERGFGIQMGYTSWQSLTLSNGGLIHLAFGAILGVSAYGRTQEKKTGTA